MTSNMDRHTILDIITHLAYSQDSLDYGLYKSLFTQDAAVHLNIFGNPSACGPKTMSTAESSEKMRMTLGGFDSTQHILSSPSIKTKNAGQEASASVSVDAFHFLDTKQEPLCDYVLMNGTWELSLLKQEQRWLIKRAIVKRPIPLEGNPNLYIKAQARTAAGEIREGVRVPG
ncbi:MAG: hypothetical protein M1822_002267 [Bathelium mastoideum]|nr:MAG: hypothetical protein M1822_002267 [Bathelium mastoideum]